jgi:hypothetical protein
MPYFVCWRARISFYCILRNEKIEKSLMKSCIFLTLKDKKIILLLKKLEKYIPIDHWKIQNYTTIKAFIFCGQNNNITVTIHIIYILVLQGISQALLVLLIFLLINGIKNHINHEWQLQRIVKRLKTTG